MFVELQIKRTTKWCRRKLGDNRLLGYLLNMKFSRLMMHRGQQSTVMFRTFVILIVLFFCSYFITFQEQQKFHNVWIAIDSKNSYQKQNFFVSDKKAFSCAFICHWSWCETIFDEWETFSVCIGIISLFSSAPSDVGKKIENDESGWIEYSLHVG